jgi:hypothetical protein
MRMILTLFEVSGVDVQEMPDLPAFPKLYDGRSGEHCYLPYIRKRKGGDRFLAGAGGKRIAKP